MNELLILEAIEEAIKNAANTADTHEGILSIRIKLSQLKNLTK